MAVVLRWLALIVVLFIRNAVFAQYPQPSVNKTYVIQSGKQAIVLSERGEVIQVKYADGTRKNITIGTYIEGTSIKEIKVERVDKTVQVTKKIIHDSLQAECIIVDRFTPTKTSIHWQTEITGITSAWSAAIKTKLTYPVQRSSKFWTSWGEPDTKTGNAHTEAVNGLSSDSVGMEMSSEWTDPLIGIPFSDALYYYGAPYLDYSKPQIAFCPLNGNLFCLPLFTIMDSNEEGLTLALSPEDNVVDLTLSTSKEGEITFSRLFNRISPSRPVQFSMDILTHESSWRSGVGWMVNRYPGFFKPFSNEAMKFGGTGSYSNYYREFNADKMKKMGYTVNWQASFDFPYMGMFLPPVDVRKKWKRFGNDSISVSEMEHAARQMKQSGFYTFSYFNITEFGANVKYPYTSARSATDPDLWMDCNDFLDKKLSTAILKVPAQMNLNGIIYPKTKNNGVFFTWEDGIVMDCGDSAYSEFLLSQARRHINDVPSSFGICIDRFDWLRMFNLHADDSITWFNGPARSLINSYKGFMNKLGPLMHNAGKTILVNNHSKRIDLLEHVDGIFDEFTYNGIALNTTALLCLSKPALGWTDDAQRVIREGGDNFFQKYLYMGVFPMCPFPGNDHSLGPDSTVDQLYLDYGKLMAFMKERKWVLKPHIVEVEGNNAKVNIFEIPGGYSLPVVYAGKGASFIKIIIKDGDFIKNARNCVAYHPGKEQPIPVIVKKISKDQLVLEVPVYRGCAMVYIQSAQQ